MVLIKQNKGCEHLMSFRHTPVLFDTSIQCVDIIPGYKRNSNQIHAHSNWRQKKIMAVYRKLPFGADPQPKQKVKIT